MKYLSVCSGIEAATSGWHHMGWEPVAFAEIEPFPSAVLKHHYPTVPNLGDMSKFKEWNLDPIDLLVGGTPCQSFSVAGLRKGLDDPRGNLMLTFGAIARHFSPRWLVWENVPGVLSSNGGRDFGTFLGMLGELGYGFAYRVLDAQYFGVAQRRRRVFVVGCLGDWRAAAAVLFELASLSGNPPPSREKGQGASGGTSPSPQYGGSDKECSDTVTSKWAKGSGGPAGNECGLFVAQPMVLMDQGGSVMSVEKDMVGTLRRETHGHEPIIAHAVAVDVYNQAIDGDTTATLTEACGGTNTSGPKVMQPIAFDTRNGMAPHGSMSGDVISPTLRAKEAEPPMVMQPIAFSSNMSVPDCQEDVSPTLKLGGHGGGNPPAVMQPVDVPEVMSTLTSSMSGVSRPGNATTEHETYIPLAKQVAPSLTTNDPSRSPQASEVTQQVAAVHAASMAVRRLTPRECERLQGFPDDHTQIPWRGKPADQCPDGPRYKALGNSMAVPVMRWIGERIRMVNELQK